MAVLLLALVDLAAVERFAVEAEPEADGFLAVVFLAAPALALVDLAAVLREVVFLAPLFAAVDFAEVRALVDLAAAGVDRFYVVDFDLVVLLVVRVAITGSYP
ncbi:MAG: hypothetical protein R3C11_03415 [Planctomycetaceae bacterium]